MNSTYLVFVCNQDIFVIPVRSHPTLEQLESLPVIRCLNGGLTPTTTIQSNDLLPQPPENEDDHIETTGSNVDLTTTTTTTALPNDVEVVKTSVVPSTNGYIKDVDLVDEEGEESRWLKNF